MGVAVGDFETRLAHPLTTIEASGDRARFAAIGQLVAEWRPVRLVVGVATRADGAEHPVGRLALRFARRLQGRYGVDVDLVDEQLTSDDAARSLREAGTRGARLKPALDAVAAQRILETFFELIERRGEKCE